MVSLGQREGKANIIDSRTARGRHIKRPSLSRLYITGSGRERASHKIYQPIYLPAIQNGHSTTRSSIVVSRLIDSLGITDYYTLFTQIDA
jgi:hypothetical protein